ncbi:hypothetical protein [Moraxella marmotae]|uniref:hypothetical protein n=1 Tax=Moraxella marmotae TaxID=3344520 RepID=UPI0035F39793
MLNRIQEEVLLKELIDDNTDIVRKNEIAIYFSDKKDERVVPILEKLINNPRYKNHRGTFVYALKNFASNKHFDLLINLLIDANYEVAHEAFDILHSIDCIEGEKSQMAYMQLNYAYQNGGEVWRKELIKEVLPCFE